MKKVRKNFLDYAKTALFIVLGNALLAFLVAAFIIPHDIIMGGTTGIAIVASIGRIVLGRKFFLTTVASSLLYPVMLGFMQKIPNIENLTDDPLLASLFAGVLMGLALGLVMRVGSSTGGMDVVNLVMHKWFHIPVSILVWTTDLIVVGFQAIFSVPEKILLGIVVLVLESLILEQVMIFGKSQTQLFIVSDAYKEIRKKLLSEMNSGVTLSHIRTGYFLNDQFGIICVIPSRKLFAITEMVQEIDPNAFITITKIKEVRGKGFTTEREPLPLKDE